MVVISIQLSADNLLTFSALLNKYEQNDLRRLKVSNDGLILGVPTKNNTH